MTVYDAQQELATLISTNWNSANTSSITPNIGKITDFPFDLQYGDNKGYVLIYSLSENEDMPGLGLQTQANVSEQINIDLRYGGMGDLEVSAIETIFNEFKAELKRILYLNRTEPTTNYCVLDLDNKSIQNKSNRMKKFFREIRTVGMDANNRDMTT